MSRQYQLVVWGATGFTGRLVSTYIMRHYGSQIQWAIGGRNSSKLETLKEELVSQYPGSVDILVGDASDLDSLTNIARQSEVICSLVGPYLKYGSLLVQACVLSQTHYCDITGETLWIRKMIDAHHKQAQSDGTKIVHCCGFDSIPSDLGVFLLQTESVKTLGAAQTDVTFYLGKSKGGLSGGTVASMLGLLKSASDSAARRVMGNPYGLNPKDGYRGPDKSDQLWVRYDEGIQRWTAPFIMAGINTRIVRRTNALLDYQYGKEFQYREVMSLPRGIRGLGWGVSMSLGIGLFALLAQKKLLRNMFLMPWLPSPGEGPDQKAREGGFFNISICGENASVRVVGTQDPGYGETSKMVGEAAMCLVFDQEHLPKQGGVLTPAVAMGHTLIERLRAKDMVFSFHANNTE
ncbi:MAG: saccharopine dehydrogenase NADP-binding domain-containing protein [Myxococcota bacterium]|nr:saccharopine dehydrogenase NADP-binding domain-containing protein [Myxococcota bacterium]